MTKDVINEFCHQSLKRMAAHVKLKDEKQGGKTVYSVQFAIFLPFGMCQVTCSMIVQLYNFSRLDAKLC
jgi:hypothetical protein